MCSSDLWLSVADPGAVDAVVRLGRELEWHGGLTCDYFADGAEHTVAVRERGTLARVTAHAQPT